MRKSKATLTSKGQITIPKTIRDYMNLQKEDQMEFIIQDDGNVFVKKAEKEVDFMGNLIMTLLNDRKVLSVTGRAGSGKTYNISELLKVHFFDKRVGLLDPLNTLEFLVKDDIDFVKPYITSSLDVEVLESHGIDILVMDEAHLLDYKMVQEVVEKGIKVIVIQQTFTKEEMRLFGNHISITIDRFVPGAVSRIEEVQIDGDRCIRTPVYSA